MAAKIIKYSMKAREAMLNGVRILADAVVVTLGPKGRHVAIEQSFGAPRVTKDGVTVADSIILLDPVENMVATLLKEAAELFSKGVRLHVIGEVEKLQRAIRRGVHECERRTNRQH